MPSLSGDFQQPRLNIDCEQTATADAKGRREGYRHGKYLNFDGVLSADHWRDGAGDHVGHERRCVASYRLAKGKVAWDALRTTREYLNQPRKSFRVHNIKLLPFSSGEREF
jgi:hypothetical protein